ncbi:hypothetical protein E2C01_028691 [Portunus trituberculatus]|uniref:Uncharacterized protein n=1 Tax=Portunus trituberculatus TaxID=210409 RepID=A0A5B7ELB9_PORTR|nr:hypothetical protein [Portunus trituberculatus]
MERKSTLEWYKEKEAPMSCRSKGLAPERSRATCSIKIKIKSFRLEYRFDDRNTRKSLLRRRIIHLEDLVKEVVAGLKIAEKDNGGKR